MGRPSKVLFAPSFLLHPFSPRSLDRKKASTFALHESKQIKPGKPVLLSKPVYGSNVPVFPCRCRWWISIIGNAKGKSPMSLIFSWEVSLGITMPQVFYRRFATSSSGDKKTFFSSQRRMMIEELYLCDTYVDVDSFLGKDLKLRVVVGHESVELALVLVPLDWVERIALHVEGATENGFFAGLTMSRNIDAQQTDSRNAWNIKSFSWNCPPFLLRTTVNLFLRWRAYSNGRT